MYTMIKIHCAVLITESPSQLSCIASLIDRHDFIIVYFKGSIQNVDIFIYDGVGAGFIYDIPPLGAVDTESETS